MKLKAHYLIFIMVYLKGSYLNHASYINMWVVWNVGQGQWVTHIMPNQCTHIDFGGEFNSFKPIQKKILHHCQNKENQLILTHWDYDHYLNIFSLARYFSKLCWMIKPIKHKINKTIKKVSQLNILYCQNQSKPDDQFLIPILGKNSNNNSIIYRHKNILISGDSPTRSEQIWAKQIALAQVRTFIIGHHGSKTSNSQFLLSELTHLKQAIASARKAKYGHPHKLVTDRFKAFKVPLLTTEDWGNIWLE
jgi:competence protein ComEC